ncbi:MAG: Dna2/Cas4 domain-containing protein, partial [Proteobacteria bacterium]|nr:Dna2/Cas4 domain-containing protein [Pseudomonadota bacterium]
CLEEMLNTEVPEGALFYGKTRHRLDVIFDVALQKETEETARRVHELIESGRTPAAAYMPTCDNCSINSLCLPKITGKVKSVKDYLSRIIKDNEKTS